MAARRSPLSSACRRRPSPERASGPRPRGVRFPSPAQTNGRDDSRTRASVQTCMARLRLSGVFALSLVLLPARAFAIHRNMPFLVSVTATPGTCHNGAPSQGLPRWVAFESSDDPLHTGNLGQQIFLLEAMVIPGLDCLDKPPGPELRQLTHFAEGAAHPSTSSSAHVVVFDSTADPMGTGSTARKVFRWDRDKRCFSDGPWADPSGGHITQVSDGSMDCSGASVDALGENIAFECHGSSGPQVFLYSVPAFKPTPTITQIGAGTNPVVNFDGKIA